MASNDLAFILKFGFFSRKVIIIIVIIVIIVIAIVIAVVEDGLHCGEVASVDVLPTVFEDDAGALSADKVVENVLPQVEGELFEEVVAVEAVFDDFAVLVDLVDVLVEEVVVKFEEHGVHEGFFVELAFHVAP